MVQFPIPPISTSNGTHSRLAITRGTLGYWDSVCWQDLETDISFYIWSHRRQPGKVCSTVKWFMTCFHHLLSWAMLAMCRGKALKPCAVCHIPREALHRLDVEHPRHTRSEMCKIIQKAQTMGKGPVEGLLRNFGLRMHEVCVYKVIKLILTSLPVSNRVPSRKFTIPTCIGPYPLTCYTPGKREYGEITYCLWFRALCHSLD